VTNLHFGNLVAGFADHGDRLAMTIRPFLQIERVSYRELQRRAYQTANYLSAQEVKMGDRVVVTAANSPGWVELFLGTELLGAILVPVDAGGSPATTLGFIEQTEPKLIFRNRHQHPELDNLAMVKVLDDLDEAIAEYPDSPPATQLTGDCPAVIVFTSGTTADPKGVVLTQRNILANAEAALRVVNVRPDWRFLSVLPLSHMYELTGGTVAVLAHGASIYYVPSASPLALARGLQDYHITTILAVPQLLVLLLKRIEQAAAAEGHARALEVASKLAAGLPSFLRRRLFRQVHSQLGGRLRLVITGGAPIPPEVGRAWERMGVRALQGYGLTETGPILTMNPLHGHGLDSPGRALDNVELRIAEDGEIQVRGSSVFREYWRDPTATRDAFTADGWFKTGDAGRLQDGWLYIEGRLKFAIVLSNGLKVFPEDVELVAAKYPALSAVCVVGVKKPNGEEVVAVVISDQSDAEISRTIDEINTQLESFQRISEWRRWPEAKFPINRLRKTDRRKVQEWANQTVRQDQAKSEERAPEEEALYKLIRETLDEPGKVIKDSDRLADIGLDSLRRLTVVALIEDELGVTIPEEEVTPSTTVEGLRQLVAAGGLGEKASPPPSWPFRKWVRLLGDATREVVVRSIVGFWVKMSVQGRERLDSLATPALYIFNHSDDFDGPVVYQALPRRVRKRLAVATADDVMRAHKVLAFIVRFCFAGFNFARSEPYMPSLEYVGTLIDRGWNVVLSPEGRLSTDGVLQPFKPGIGLLAVELDVPVVPVKTIGLFGTVPLHSKWPKRHSVVTVRIGEPTYFDRHLDYDDVTLRLHQILEDL
jgi:long-chain acyl-CoA synthetase